MMNYNNKMKEVLGTHLELMMKNRAFDSCSYIDEDRDQIYCIIKHSFDLYKNNDFEDLSSKIEYIENTSLKKILQEKESLDYHLQLIEIYKTIINT